ncbi:MAG: hypothetical protein H6902_04685 [Rhodobacteraceae bacterium]|nr:hypothetical protein [Paracoccaceae bacterium]
MAKFLDRDHPMFRRATVRAATVALPLAWAAFEFAGGATLWGVIFGALGLYALWELFLRKHDERKDR